MKSRGLNLENTHDGSRADLPVVRVTVYHAGVDSLGGDAAGSGTSIAAGSPQAGLCADRAAGPGTSHAVVRRGLLGLPGATRQALPVHQHVDFIKCQVLRPRPEPKRKTAHVMVYLG